MTPRHRFRVASHSKSFTATAILRLKEEARLRLDDPVGSHVEGLHPSVARVTLGQLLSHGAGVVRDGTDAGQWIDERPFAVEAELRSALTAPLVIPPDSRMKYSNHGFGLLGLVIEAVTGESYSAWITRNIIRPSGLKETTPDTPFARGTPVARGHSGELPLGERVVIPADNSHTCAGTGDRLRLDGKRSGPLLCKSRSRCRSKCPHPGEPAGHDPLAVARSSRLTGRRLRPRHVPGTFRRLGMGRSRRWISRGQDLHRHAAGPRDQFCRAYQCQ